MKLPEPYLYCDDEGECISPEMFNLISNKDDWEPLYSETQLRAEIERRDAVLRLALEAFSEVAAWESSGDPFHPASKAIKAIREVLG